MGAGDFDILYYRSALESIADERIETLRNETALARPKTVQDLLDRLDYRFANDHFDIKASHIYYSQGKLPKNYKH